jgi:hypothetical protein
MEGIDGRSANTAIRGGNVRVKAFYALIAMVLLVAIRDWRSLATPILIFLPDDVVASIHLAGADNFHMHLIHRLVHSLTSLAALFGFALQLRRPGTKVAPMWQGSGIVAVGLILAAIIRPPTDAVPTYAWFIVGLGVLVGLLHPASALRQLPRVHDRMMTGLTAAITIPMLFYAVDHVIKQMTGSELNPHWVGLHYEFVAEFGFDILLLALLGSSSLAGWRYSAWSAGVIAAFLAAASIVNPGNSSSLGTGWGLALAIWAIVFVIATVRRGGRPAAQAAAFPAVQGA